MDLGTAVKHISLKKRDGIYTHGLGILLRYGDGLAMVGIICGDIFCIKHHHLFCNTTITFSFDLFFRCGSSREAWVEQSFLTSWLG